MQLSGITPTGSAVNFADELHRGKANLAVIYATFYKNEALVKSRLKEMFYSIPLRLTKLTYAAVKNLITLYQ